MKLPSNSAFFRSTPGSTSLGPAYTSALASTGQALEFLASSDRSAFVKSVNSVAQALQDSVSDMQKSGSKRATCVQPSPSPNVFVFTKLLHDCRQLLRLPSAASDEITLSLFMLLVICIFTQSYCRRPSFPSALLPLVNRCEVKLLS